MKTLRKLWQLTTLLLDVMPGMARATTTNTDQRPKQRTLGVPLALLLMLSVLTSGALAGNCMDDVSPLDGLVCTANDVRVAQYNVIDGPTSIIAGEYMTVTLQAELISTASERYDIGFFVALDGGDALNGSCFREFLLPPLCPRNESPDCIYNPNNGPFYNAEYDEDINDTCGDLEQGVTTYRNLTPITIIAQDSDGDGIADVSTCVSWDNGKSDGTANKPSCTCIEDVLPNTKSKCRCEPVRIGNITILGQIIVDKVTDPAEDPQSFNFTLTGGPGNTDVSFNLTDQDAPFESEGLESGTYNVTEFLPDYWELKSVTCDDGSDPIAIDLYPGEIVTCNFTNLLVFVPAPAINLIKTMADNADEDESGDVSIDDTLTYTFNVNNTGNVDLDPVSVSDPMPGLSDITCVATSLAPNASMECTATYTVTQADVDARWINNTATATGTSATGGDVIDTDDEDVPVPTPSKTIDKTSTLLTDADGSGDVSVGDTIEYTYTVENTGTANLTGVTVEDNLLGTVTLSDVADNGVGLMAPGDIETGTLTYVVQSTNLGTTIHNVGTGDSDQTDPVTDDENVPVPFPALAIEKTGVLDLGPDGIANPGDVITYSYNVTANGTANLTNITVTDLLPGLIGINCLSGNPIPFLAAGAMETCTATYQITQADIEAGQRDNVATADSVQTDPVQDNETVPIPQSPSIDVEKYVSVDGGETWVDADDPTYPDMIFRTNPQFKFVVNNTGNVNLTGIILTDIRLNMSGCNVPDPLAVGVSYECFATDPWTPVLYNNTVNVTVNFGGKNYSDEDDAHYWAPSHVSP